ncbi:uncharacterized protein LOC131645991 [Vicia villosa]|uniref:uncharacterized protein LOC131645991 n=1 Tax=Vicia villosa TaxID=3911 RepID=UPI00273BDFB5|nr:uncharacterized protein LOC131645991 [Vicia villosa]
MPMNNGQSQQSTRWYKQCFMPTSGDSSDDSDTESVVIAPCTSTHTSIWQEPSPPHSPPHPEPDIDWLPLPPPPPPDIDRLPLPPPPPPPFLPLTPLQRSSQMPSLWQPLSPSPNPVPQLNWNWRTPPPPPPPPVLLTTLALQPPPPRNNGSPSVIEEVRPGVNQTEFLRIPDSVINAIQMVTISELHESDELSQCPICMEDFKLGDQACQLPCNHRYKFECILRWLNNNTTCPVCRLQLEGFVGEGSCYNINDDGDGDGDHDDDSLDLEPQIPPPEVNISLEDLFQFSPRSHVTENGADHNSDEGDYDSACDDLGDAHEDGERFGNNSSSRNSQI